MKNIIIVIILLILSITMFGCMKDYEHSYVKEDNCDNTCHNHFTDYMCSAYEFMQNSDNDSLCDCRFSACSNFG